MSSLPPNVHLSQHPCLQAKLSQLRSKSADSKDVKSLVHDIGLIVACEAFASVLKTTSRSKVDALPLAPGIRCFRAPPTQTRADGTRTRRRWASNTPRRTSRPRRYASSPSSAPALPWSKVSLRSPVRPQPRPPVPSSQRLAVQTMMPRAVPVHHLGMYRDQSTLAPVEYYNNLPRHVPSSSSPSASSLAVIVDPVIATGGTCAAAIQTLREWGAERILVLSIVGAADGVADAAKVWPEGTEIWLAGLDAKLTAQRMLEPGVGDIGDRLFLTDLK
ncbi:hypothetical protein DCS_03175 [Drechmeria coniospora]|uniref:uracil phosphoribosyltransferase n=1 Tax=Drechmeria coniospora TaxID=98403 RepID=A0A151GY65_DRECN|nr:hypothetical protein DCS_03175 [Drechmeria coniospora]KYK62030.1 hypothetical protein DCS_03175 [Drechmeria coniospora]